MVAIPEHLDR